jgi:hypothetical protein
MAFGQPSGPPASAKQLKQLLALLMAAGYADFRDARGPMGFTQRQGGGKFTKDEADGFITALEFAAQQDDLSVAAPPAPTDAPAPDQTATQRAAARASSGARSGAEPAAAPAASGRAERISAAEQTLRRFPANMLAAELQRRGWIVVEP